MADTTTHVVARFREHCQRRRYAPATIDKRCAVVRRWITATADWRTAGWRDVELWLTDRTWNLSPSAQRDVRSHLRMFYRWAQREGLADHDPTQLVELPRQPRRLPRPVSEGTLRLALTCTTPAVAGMVALMAGAGLRCCEVATLRWVDVELTEHRLWIRHGKGGHERVVPLSRDVARYLAAADAGAGHVFMSPAGRPYTATRVSQVVNAAMRQLGVAATAHQFRHRYATVALAGCGDLTVVAQLLGHVSTATTEGYAQVHAAAATRTGLSINLP